MRFLGQNQFFGSSQPLFWSAMTRNMFLVPKKHLSSLWFWHFPTSLQRYKMPLTCMDNYPTVKQVANHLLKYKLFTWIPLLITTSTCWHGRHLGPKVWFSLEPAPAIWQPKKWLSRTKPQKNVVHDDQTFGCREPAQKNAALYSWSHER